MLKILSKFVDVKNQEVTIMHSIYILPYRLSSALFLSLLLAVPVKADIDIVASGALNFFFPHAAVSVSLGQPIYRYGDRKTHRSSQYHKHRYSHRRYSNSYFIVKKPHKRSYRHSTYSPREKYQSKFENRGYRQQDWQHHKNEVRRKNRAGNYVKHERKHRYFLSEKYR
jgi:hypothetical protein